MPSCCSMLDDLARLTAKGAVRLQHEFRHIRFQKSWATRTDRNLKRAWHWRQLLPASHPAMPHLVHSYEKGHGHTGASGSFFEGSYCFGSLVLVGAILGNSHTVLLGLECSLVAKMQAPAGDDTPSLKAVFPALAREVLC